MIDSIMDDNISRYIELWDQAVKSDVFPKKQVEVAPWETSFLTEEKVSSVNPIHPDSVGKDQDQPNPVWVQNDGLKEIAELKQKIHDLESKVSGYFGDENESKMDKVISQVNEMRKQLDRLSNKFGIDDEPAMFVINNDKKPVDRTKKEI